MKRRQCPSPRPRASAPQGRARPSARQASAPPRESGQLPLQPSARYGRSHGCASNSNACVVSCRAIQVRNGSSGDAQRRGGLAGCSPRRTAAGPASPRRRAARCRTGRGPAGPGSRAGGPAGAWPGTGWRARRCRPSAVAGRQDLVEEALRGGRSAPAKVAVLARTQPARSTTPAWRSTTPGSCCPRWRLEAGHDRRHRRGVRRLGAPQLGRASAPGARRRRPSAIAPRGGQSTRPAPRRPSPARRPPVRAPARPAAAPTTRARGCARAPSSSVRTAAAAPPGSPPATERRRVTATPRRRRATEARRRANTSPISRSAVRRNASHVGRRELARGSAAVPGRPAPRAR